MTNFELKTIKRDELSPVAALGTLFFFIFGFLITHEVSVQDSLQLCGVLLLDLITGALIWVFLSRKTEYSVFELFGVGVSLGTSLNAIGQLVFRSIYLGRFFSYLLLLFVVALVAYSRRSGQLNLRTLPTKHTTILAICLPALVLLCGDRYYLWAGVLILGSTHFIFYKLSQSVFKRIPEIYSAILIGSITVSLLSASILENIIFGPRSTKSYISGWDSVYFEAASKSIINFGPFDNFLIANNKYAYYWFSDAWSGAITQRAMVNDWVVTTQFGFILAAVVSISLCYEILRHWVLKHQYITFLLIPIATASFVGHPLNLLYLQSFSQVIAVVLTTQIFFLLSLYIRQRNMAGLALLIFSAPLLMLTKTLIALPIITGLLIGVVFLVIKSQSRKQYHGLLISILLIIITSAITYLIFIQPDLNNRGDYAIIKIWLNGNIFGILSSNVFLSSAMFLALPITVLIIAIRHNMIDDLSVLLIAISCSSFVLSLILKFNNSHASTYLIVPFFLTASILTAKSVDFSPISSYLINFKMRSLFIVSQFFAVSVGFLSTTRLHYLNYNFVQSETIIMTTGLIPFIVTFTIIAILWNQIRIYRLIEITFPLVIALTLISVSIGFYIGNSFRELTKEYVYKKNQWDLVLGDVEIEISRLTKPSNWIITEFNSSDLIASNSSSDRGLLAALTGIRNYASSYAPNLWSGEEHRYGDQKNFADSPSKKSYEALRDGCVTVFYYDKDESPGRTNSFEPYATTMYEDEFGAVLKLSDTYPLPDECLD